MLQELYNPACYINVIRGRNGWDQPVENWIYYSSRGNIVCRISIVAREDRVKCPLRDTQDVQVYVTNRNHHIGRADSTNAIDQFLYRIAGEHGTIALNWGGVSSLSREIVEFVSIPSACRWSLGRTRFCGICFKYYQTFEKDWKCPVCVESALKCRKKYNF